MHDTSHVLIAKLAGVFAAVIGAGIIAATRPPATRGQLFAHAAVAIGSSILFGHQVAVALDPYVYWVDLAQAGPWESLDYYVAVHGLVGAASWGVWGYISSIIERVRSSDEGLLVALRNAIFGERK